MTRCVGLAGDPEREALMDARERLVAAMPSIDELDARRIWPWELEHRPFDVRWSHGSGGPPTFVCRELSQSRDDTCWLGFYDDEYTGRHRLFLRVWAGDPPERRPLPATAVRAWFERLIDEGDCSDGRVWLSHYAEGADLGALRRAGVELSWSAARCLHVAARAPLAVLHEREVMHDAISPSRIRLALFPEPYTGQDPTAPVRFCAPLCGTGGATAAARELAELAAAVCTLTCHPEPHVDALLRDPSPDALAVLADLLLERGAPVDELLADRLRGAGAAAALATLPHADSEEIQAELEALWRRVMELCILMRPA